MPNLEDVLRALSRPSIRYDEKPNIFSDRLLWIDAICIYQEDIQERNHQVSIMGGIYSRSTSLTTIWLGNPLEHTDDAMTFIQAYNSMSKEEIKAWTDDKVSTDSYAMRLMLHAAAELLDRPWFRRCWVVQEFVLCKERKPDFQCGHYLISSKAFPRFGVDAHVSSPKLLQLYTKEAAYYDPRILAKPCAQGLMMWSAYSRFKTRSKTSTLDWLLLYNDLEPANPRYKLSGFLGLQRWGGKREIPDINAVSNGLIIDYDASVEDLYSSVVRNQVNSTHKLDILRSCGPRSGLVTRSWVPDWMISSISEAHKVLEFDGRSETSRETQCIASFADDLSFMIVRGFVWDTIRLVEKHWPSQLGDGPYYSARQEFCRAAWS